MPCQGGPQLPPRATRRLQSPPPFHAEPATAIVIGGGGIWSCTRLRAIAAEARIGAALARAYVPPTEGLLPGTATSLPPPGERPGPLRLFGPPGPEADPNTLAGPNGHARASSFAAPRPQASPARPVRQFSRPTTTSSGARRRSPTAPRRSASTPATPGCTSSGQASAPNWTATRKPSPTTTGRSASTPTLRRPTSAAATRSPSWGCTRRPSRTTTVSSSLTPTRPRHSWRDDPARPEPPLRWDGTCAGPSTQPHHRD